VYQYLLSRSRLSGLYAPATEAYIGVAQDRPARKSGSYTLLMMRALTSLRAAASGETIGW